MTKAELIEKMATTAGISKAAAGAAFDELIGSITKGRDREDCSQEAAEVHCRQDIQGRGELGDF